MNKFLALIFISLTTTFSFANASIPLDKMKCSGPFVADFFVDLTPRPDLNNYVEKLGRDPNTFYKFELAGDVFTSKPTFKGDHSEEYVFLTITGSLGFSVSRFFMSSSGFVLMAQHPVQHLPKLKVLHYRQIGNPENPPDWVCQY